MKCDQCGKHIKKSNKHSVLIDGKTWNLCGKHYTQYVKFHHFLDNNQKSVQDLNDFVVTKHGVYVYTFNHAGKITGRMIIDRDDLDRVIVHKWRFWAGNFFTGVKQPISISRFIMNVTDPKDVVDYINGDRSDNRKSNLRVTTQQMNMCNKELLSTNTSEFAGVSYDKDRKKWCPEIRLGGKKCYLGRYINKCDSVFARYYAETRLFGEYRSTRNDDKINSYIEKCMDKEEIRKYVDMRLRMKYHI